MRQHLSERQLHALQKHLAAKAPFSFPCMVCGERAWSMGDHFLFSPRADWETGEIDPDPTHGSVCAFLACESCGFLVQFLIGPLTLGPP